jgi:bifunctional oligoribonuclease and PAP phosphatase NrnA
VKRVMEGKVAYVYMSYQEAKKLHISYEDIHPISGMLRDCEDIEMGFSMYEEAPNIWRCSFRSDGQWINVNEMMKSFGGGGHAAAAGLRRETDQPEVLLEQLLAQIESIQSLG